MAGRASKFRLVRCPKCCRLLIEYADIPRYQCGSCNALLQAKNCNVIQESVTSGSGSGSSSLRIFLNSSEQSIPSSSSLCSSPAYNAEGTLNVIEQKQPFPLPDQSISIEKDCKSAKNKLESPSDHPRNRYRLMSRRTFRLERVSESNGGESNGEEASFFQIEQQLNKHSLKGRNSSKEIDGNDSKLKCIDEAQVNLFNDMSYHQSSICRACSCYSYHNSVKKQVNNSSMKEKQHQARRHCRPIFNAAPFFTCNKCFELLWLPEDFLVSKKGLKKLRCGSCSEVVILSFPAVSVEESCFHGRQGKEDPPLHQLMGYFSATELLCQVSEEDEGYESSEPAMPDSYKLYEEGRKNLFLQHLEDEEHDSYKMPRRTALPPLNRLVKGVKRTWARNSGSLKLKAPASQ